MSGDGAMHEANWDKAIIGFEFEAPSLGLWECMISAMRSSTAHFKAMESAKPNIYFHISAWPLRLASISGSSCISIYRVLLKEVLIT